MKQLGILLLLYSVLMQCAFAQPQPVETLTWRKLPLRIDLPVGQERIIEFPEEVQLKIDRTLLMSKKLRVINANNTAYLVASEPFDVIRIKAQLKDTQDLIQIDLSASATGKSAPIKVVLANKKLSPSDTTKQGAAPTSTPVNQERIDDITLARHAIQQLYSPKRLIKQYPDIHMSSFGGSGRRTVNLYQGAQTIAMPLMSFRNQTAYVTAVKLRNMSENTIELSPYSIRGQWKGVIFYPLTKLMPAGHREDTTTIFLISHVPFDRALEKRV